MARKEVLIDDLTGEAVGEITAHTFALDGRAFEIDLSPDSLERLEAALEEFIDAARETTRVKRETRRRRSSSTPDHDPAAVRAWAEESGIEVNSRGRIKREIVEAYLRENSPASAAEESADDEDASDELI